MDEDKISTRDIPVYEWPTIEKGKAQYPKFAMDFQGTLKGLRIVVEAGGIDRFLGTPPGRRPIDKADRPEWLAKTTAYQNRKEKIEMYCATALGILEKSFAYGTTPLNIIRKAAECPADKNLSDWTYRLRFEACWKALKEEYQPSTIVDLKQLKDQIMKLNDQGPGGFDAFKAEFHRLHAEIMATGVTDAVTERELNDIVREGIKNPFVWVNICYNLYKNDLNAPWAKTFDAITTALTSFRQKGFDPYGESKSGPIAISTPVAANAATTFPSKSDHGSNKRPVNLTKDDFGRINKKPKPNHAAPSSFTPWVGSSNSHGNGNFNPPSTQRSQGETPARCTRCWQPNSHSFKTCAEAKCACGEKLFPGQVICANYDNHPTHMKFLRKMPSFIQTALQSIKKSKSRAGGTTQANRNTGGNHDRRPKINAMNADVTNEIGQAPSQETFDDWE